MIKMIRTNNRRDLEKVLKLNGGSSTELSQIDYGIDVTNRIIYLEDEIDIYTAGFVQSRINAIISLSTHKTKDDPITLEITSYGGDVYGMLAAVDVIKHAPVKINTLGRGPIMSAATFILAAGTGERSITKNSIVMVHELSTLLGGTSKDILTEAAHIEKLQVKLYKLLANSCSKDANYWEENSKVNLYLDAQEAIEHGIIDNIKE
tara:strand:+ start:12937 stop:13554 length:618 start_codon:yes stop_codon:yes gene_type:complete